MQDDDDVERRRRIDDLVHTRKRKPTYGYESKSMERVLSNIGFAKKIQDHPIKTTRYDKKIFGVETINLQHYIEQRVWPRSIYTTDKLCRLTASSTLEYLKRYLKKRNKMDFDIMWILLIVIGICAFVFILIFIVPKLGGLGGIVPGV